MTVHDIEARTVRATELYGDFWFNSGPVPLLSLRGSVVLLHFWDYACPGSNLDLPYVRAWEKSYRDHGLMVIGVHVPKYPFSSDPTNVQAAIERLGVTYPVVMDNGHILRGRYGVRAWPSLILVDHDGFIRALNEGEGSYLATERVLQRMLLDASPSDQVPDLTGPIREQDRPGAVCYRATPEVFAGYLRGSIGNVEGSVPESVGRFSDPEVYVDGRLYLGGNWREGRELLQLEEDEAQTGQVILPYDAQEVYGVLDCGSRGSVEVTIRQDDAFLTPSIAGQDVRIHGDGRSTILVDMPRLYRLVKNKSASRHVLRLIATGDGLKVYSFGFLAGVIPELIYNN